MEGSPADFVNTTQVAKALGVSVSTVKRWVDDGILPAQKTAGGHRKLLLADVVELARRDDLPLADLSFLVAGKRSSAAEGKSPTADMLYRALRQGDGDSVRALLGAALRAQVSIEHLADTMIGPAMERIGRDWETGRIDVMEEHLASQLCSSALYELKGILAKRAGKSRPRAVGGAVAGDYSILPTLLAQMVLVDAGWDAINLGPNSPFESLAKAIVDFKPRLLWLSASHIFDESAFLVGYRKLYAAAERAKVAVAVGGRALDFALRSKIPYTTYGDGLSHLSAFARTLHPLPARPRRGRPRSEDTKQAK